MQSSTFDDKHAASKAIDGKLKGTGPSGGCSSTDRTDKEQWWRAEFDNVNTIAGVKLLARSDKYRTRYAPRVTVSTKEDGNWTLCEDLGDRLSKVEENGQTWVEAKCPPHTLGKYVKVTLHKKEFLMLCEVEAFGVSANGKNNCVIHYQKI